MLRVAAIAFSTVLLSGCTTADGPRAAAPASPVAEPATTAKGPTADFWTSASPPVTSPDGSMSAWDERDQNGAHVYLRTSSGTRQLAFATEPIEIEGWWPDGQGLLIRHYWGYCNSCNADGIRLASLSINGRFADLSDFHRQAGTYAWSHHGDLLIGTGGDRFVVSGNPRLVICNAQAASCKEMPRPEGTADLTPAWSPDDKFIVFARGTKPGTIPVEASWQDSLEIWIARADGSSQKKLQAPGGSYPTWSSDGKSISFIRGGTWWRHNLYTGQSEATAQTVAGTSGRGWISYLVRP